MRIGRMELNPKRILLFVGIVVLILLVMDFNARVEDMVRLSNQAATVQAEATQIMQTQIVLQTAVAYATSDAAVRDWARNQNSMVQPGDQPIQPLPASGDTPFLQPTPTALSTPMSNWGIWMELLFGR